MTEDPDEKFYRNTPERQELQSLGLLPKQWPPVQDNAILISNDLDTTHTPVSKGTGATHSITGEIKHEDTTSSITAESVVSIQATRTEHGRIGSIADWYEHLKQQ